MSDRLTTVDDIELRLEEFAAVDRHLFSEHEGRRVCYRWQLVQILARSDAASKSPKNTDSLVHFVMCKSHLSRSQLEV